VQPMWSCSWLRTWLRSSQIHGCVIQN